MHEGFERSLRAHLGVHGMGIEHIPEHVEHHHEPMVRGREKSDVAIALHTNTVTPIGCANPWDNSSSVRRHLGLYACPLSDDFAHGNIGLR